jgi:hypothetical protein
MGSWVETLKADDFAARASTAERAILVSLTGTADLTVKDQLDIFLRDVHSEAQRSLVEEVIVDVRLLEFMNSSCLKCLVRWITTVQKQPGEQKYRIVFVSSPSVFWQQRSLNPLACLANDVVTIQA